LAEAVQGLHCGVKKKADAYDVGIVLSTTEAAAAACFTRNAFQAAPVTVSREVLARQKGKARAVVVNSGCANAVTGTEGMQNAQAMSKAMASRNIGDALVLSTGVIGQQLPIRRILGGIDSGQATLSSSFQAWHALARAFMTTDTFPKLRTRAFDLDGTEVRFVGIDKGAGMIHPNMGPPSPPHATLLGLIATDAAVEPESLQVALTHAVDRSFNSISVDGDMSTNDTVLALANGAADGTVVSQHGTPELFARFTDELTSFATELAQLIVRDGEGATKFVKVGVVGSPTFEGARHIASTISRSSLVKTALNGEDANWGRILCAVGYSNPPGFSIDPTRVSVSFIPTDGSAALPLLVKGEPEKVDEARASEILAMEDLEILVDLGLGDEQAA
jgi:glutamate N-acetyltransferase/amino-acid N-acetyltransferase